MLTVQILVVVLYVTIVLELTVFHVPSVASSLNIWKPREEVLKFYSKKYASIFQMARWKKFCLFILPLGMIYLTYFFPSFLYFESPIDLMFLFQPNTIIMLIGLVTMLVGRFITFSSVLTIRKKNEQKGNSFTLHTEGGFSKTRNPGLLGLYLFLFGIWLILPSTYFLLGIMFYMGYMHFKVLMEEDFLSNRYGESYAKYLAATKRYF